MFRPNHIKGTKLTPSPKMPTKRASAAETKKTQDKEPGKAEESTSAIEARPKKALRTTATEKQVWKEKSDSTNPDTDIPDFP